MEVSPEVFTWLVSLHLLSPETAPISLPLKRLLPPSTSLSLEHASFFRLLFQRTLSPVHFDPFPDLSVLIDSPSPAGKLANWSFVFDICASLSVKVSEDRKMLILAGDYATIAGLLGDIRIAITLVKNGKGKRPKVAQDGALFIESVNEKRPMEEAESCLEFLLLSLSQSFGVSTKQAAGLLTQGNKYLAQIVTKGLKTDFLPIRSWYHRLKSCVVPLTALILKESQSGSLALVLSAFRPGLLSKEESVVLDCASLFLSLVPQLTLNSEQCWDWFTGQPGGIDACYNAMQRFPGPVVQVVAGVLHEAARFKYKDLLVLHLRAQSGSVMEYLQALSELVPSLAALPQAVERLLEEPILPDLIETALREADSDAKRSTSGRSSALTFLSVLWKSIPSYFEEHENLVNSMLAMMKKACRDKSKLLSCLSAGHLFALLVKLYAGRSQYAPLIFKSLTFLMIETFENSDFKEFMMSNFVILLGEIQSLPISSMVEPMIKQLNLMQDLEMNCGDFDFFVAIARHPRLALEHAIMLSDICGKQYLAQVHLARAAGVPLLFLAKRYLNTEVMREFIFRFTKLSLGVLIQSEKDKRLLPKKKPLYNNKPVVVGAPITPEELVEEMAKSHQNRLILNFVCRIIGLESVEINNRVRDLLITSITELHRTKFDYHKGMMKVLGLLGNAIELLGTRDSTVELAAIKPRKRQRFEILAEPTAKVSMNQALLRGTQPYSTTDLDPKKSPLTRKPYPKKSIWPKKHSSNGDSPIFSYYPSETPLIDIVKIREMDYSDQDLDNLRAAMRMFARLTKHLFRNYCGSSYARSSHDLDTFGQKETKKTHIREAEIYKLLKDNGVSNFYILKEQFSSLLKSYCVKNHTLEATAVDYTQFLELIVQIALFVFSRQNQDLSHLPPAVSVLSFFELIKSHWKSNGKPLTLFDPPYLLHGDRETVLQLNRQLLHNPSMDLPEGFKRTNYREIELKFELSEETGVKESFRFALGLVDEIVWESIGIRLLDPKVVVRTIVRVEAMGGLCASSSVGDIRQEAPTAIHRNPGLKFEMAKLQKKYAKEDLMEIAKLIDDLITNVEAEAAAHMRRGSTGRIQNRALFLRELKEKQHAQVRALAEQKRRQRQEELESLLAKANDTKRKQERKERHKRKKAERAKQEVEERLRERRKREMEARAAEMVEWMNKKQAEEQEKRKAEFDKQQVADAAKKLQRQKYEKVIKHRLEQLIKQKTEERKLEFARAEAEAKLNTSKREVEKRKASEVIELERKRRESEQQMKRDFAALSANGEIVNVLEEYKKAMEVVFEFYVKVGARDLRAAMVLQWQGLYKFCLQFFLLPEIVSTEELTILYRMYTKEKSVSEPGIVIGMDKSEFFDCIIRIAALGQNQLRNRPGEQFQFALEDCNALTVKALLRYMEIPTDPKRVIDLLKLLTLQPPIHPRERKRISRGNFSSERLAGLEDSLIAESKAKRTSS